MQWVVQEFCTVLSPVKCDESVHTNCDGKLSSLQIRQICPECELHFIHELVNVLIWFI